MAPRDKAAVAKNTLVDSVLKLEAHYGAPGPPPTTDPFEMIVWENAAYLVDDTRRRTVFELLRRKVGMEPEAIAAAPLEKLAAVIEVGGMRPAMRAGKLRTAAALALEIGLARLREAVRSSPAEARKLLKRFPGIGDPGADKILAVRARPAEPGARLEHSARPGAAGVWPGGGELRQDLRLGRPGCRGAPARRRRLVRARSPTLATPRLGAV